MQRFSRCDNQGPRIRQVSLIGFIGLISDRGGRNVSETQENFLENIQGFSDSSRRLLVKADDRGQDPNNRIS